MENYNKITPFYYFFAVFFMFWMVETIVPYQFPERTGTGKKPENRKIPEKNRKASPKKS